MTVKELIAELQTIENQDLPVMLYDNMSGDLLPIDYMDETITDRVDLCVNANG